MLTLQQNEYIFSGLLNMASMNKKIKKVVTEILIDHKFNQNDIAKFLDVVKKDEQDDIYDKLYHVISSPDRTEVIKKLSGCKNIIDILPVEREQTYDEVLKELDIKPERSDKYPCKNSKCGNKFCFAHTLQTRRADEGATVYVLCPECQSFYKIN
jgi:DNA-directed RNA polymerase subunit M/transcription elongation factor TFIIS